MPHQPKIATCCYCGTRAALVLTGKQRHELACSNCGAPLHDLKMLRSDARGDRELVEPTPSRKYTKPKPAKSSKKRKPKKRKSFSRRFFEEIGDIAEDVFDIFD